MMSENPAKPELTDREPTKKELALSFLDYEGKRIGKEIVDSERALRFYHTYEPKIAVRPSYIESGSMDASDWDVAEAEADQWPEERDQMIDLLEQYIEKQHELRNGQLEVVSDIKEGDGNEYLIDHFAELEKERRRKEETKQKSGEKITAAS